MNKFLIGTAAAALMVSPAVAGPIAVTVGGYQNTMVYLADHDDSIGEVYDQHILEDGEMIIKGKGKTNSGLTVGFQMQFETADDGDHSDEHYFYVKGDFGKVEVGGENSVASKMTVSAPKFLGWKTYDNNFGTWAGIDGDNSFRKPLPGNDEGSKDAAKINYYSPKINGLQVGLSYTPNTADTDGPSMDVAGLSNSKYEGVISYGLKYSGKIGGGKLKASYTAETAEDAGDGATENSESAFGLNYSVGPYEFGMTQYTREKDEAGSTNHEEDVLHYGVQYKLSKNTKIGLMMHSQTTENGTVDTHESDIMVLGGSTKLGSGVTLTYSHETVEYTDLANAFNSGDGTYTGVGLLLKF